MDRALPSTLFEKGYIVCGIAGIVGRPGMDPSRGPIVRRMAASLVHRGPDGEGFVALDGCDLGFRRLAIVDVEAEASPFCSTDRTVWAVCNGEIYNYPELRADLESRGHRLRTSVDTEILPHLYQEFGADFIERLDGMFAFAIWDEPRRRLMLGRDRAGEKPLFYWCGPDEIVFASELRAILEHPRTPREVNATALTRYLLHDYFPAPLSPIRGVHKLPAGCFATVGEGDLRVQRYWDLAGYFQQGPGKRRGDAQLADELDARISTAIQRRRRSDVPVGVFLSGGIDSSTVLAHLTEQAGPGVPVYALGHSERSFDESHLARRTAEAFDADFHGIVLTEADLADGLRRIGEGLDEPLGDASTIPTHLLARAARKDVKVVLSGEGADELFAGYPTYLGSRLADGFARLPGAARRAVAATVLGVTPVKMSNVGLDYLMRRFLAGIDRPAVERHHTWFGSLSPERQQGVLSPRVLAETQGVNPFASARELLKGKSLPDALSVLLYTDFSMYLQDDLLTKVDRATMLASLEARAPFLDHELAEFAAGLPSRQKLRGLTTKAVLRRSVKKRLPREVLARRKRGFNIPFSKWLFHGLGDSLRERFSTERVEARGLLCPDGVRTLLDEHLSHRADHRKPLFTLLALDLWCDRTYGEGAYVPLSAPAVPARVSAV